MIRLLDAAISLLYKTSDAAVSAAYRLGGPRNRLAARRWDALADDEVPF